jgi:hypothetical protein
MTKGRNSTQIDPLAAERCRIFRASLHRTRRRHKSRAELKDWLERAIRPPRGVSASGKLFERDGEGGAVDFARK